jgi:alpha-glucosidase
MTGPDLLDLRKDYMELTGRPLVPPKKMFGFWLSEYGYDNWNELEDKLKTLRANNFPLDGFVLDLQWFGGISDVTGKCNMGFLDFDTTTFPDPMGEIKTLQDSNGVGVMLIEEAYVCKNLAEYSKLQEQGCLVKNHPGGTEPDSLSGFWGSGGMIDFTDDNCSRFWDDLKRQKLIGEGVLGHWTDLGEPEVFDPKAGYSVGTHADAHNIFNFRWIRGIYQGYVRRQQLPHPQLQRPFIMSRSGTAGIQRFGAAMWSGDIASKLSSLAAHAGSQMHMSFSGIDYYGADVGGFQRWQHDDPFDLDGMYTQWYANGMMFDVPGRPHTDNHGCKFPTCSTPKDRETAPDRVGDFKSNLENTRQRYELIPYVYSLAHRAYRTGEPVIPPPVIYYQTDNNVRSKGDEKMIGRDLLAAVVAKVGETERDVYLPAGGWFDWYTNERINSIGMSIPKVPNRRNGIFKLPLYAREGAIIPLAFVDDSTMNAIGKRKDSSTHNELIAKVFAFGPKGGVNSFTLYEDDGTTIAYQQGAVQATEISQKRDGNQLTVGVNKSEGTYEGAPASRNNVIKLVTDDTVTKVTLNGSELKEFSNMDDFNRASSGWINAGNNTVIAKSGDMSVSDAKNFVIALVPPTPCISKYSAISVPGEGNGWNPTDPARTLKLSCEAEKNIWQGRIKLSSEQYKFAANGSWQINWGCDGKQNGPNCPPRAEGSGTYDVTFKEDDPAHPEFKLVTPDGVSARFICEKGFTNYGTSVYVVGSIPELHLWKPEDADSTKLNPDGPYPTWTGLINNLPPNTRIEWKCIIVKRISHYNMTLFLKI